MVASKELSVNHIDLSSMTCTYLCLHPLTSLLQMFESLECVYYRNIKVGRVKL